MRQVLIGACTNVRGDAKESEAPPAWTWGSAAALALVPAAVIGWAAPVAGVAVAALLLGAVAIARAQVLRALRRARALGALEAQARERRRWAGALHDDTLQQLVALKLLLATADGGAQRSLATAGALLDEQVTSLQHLVKDLRPPALEGLGLAAAVAELAERVRTRHGLTATVSVQLQPAARGHDVDEAVYRVVQEALTNVAKHAHAAHAAVRVAQDARRLTVTVADDGRGMPPRPRPDGLGLAGMRERAVALGGRLAVSATPHGGTTVAMTLPLRRHGGRPAGERARPARAGGPAELPVPVVDQAMRRFRWAGAAFALVQLSITTPPAFPLLPMPVVGALIAAAVAALNLGLPDTRGLPPTLQRRVGLVQVAVDAAFVLVIVAFNQFDEQPAAWIGLLVVMVEAALRTGPGGTFATWAATSAAYLAIAAWGAGAYDRPFGLDEHTRIVGLALLVAILGAHVRGLLVAGGGVGARVRPAGGAGP